MKYHPHQKEGGGIGEQNNQDFIIQDPRKKGNTLRLVLQIFPWDISQFSVYDIEAK